MMTSLVSCVVDRIQLRKQLEVCGVLLMVSVSNHPSANIKSPHDNVWALFSIFFVASSILFVFSSTLSVVLPILSVVLSILFAASRILFAVSLVLSAVSSILLVFW